MKRFYALETPDGWVVAVNAIDTDCDATIVTEKGARDWAARLNASLGRIKDRGRADERQRIVERLLHAANLVDPDEVSRTALTLEKMAMVLVTEGGAA